MNWLLFLSQLPATPSSLRVTIWRKMRAEGALGLQNGVWLLPDRPEQLAFVQELSEFVKKQGAGSQVFKVSPLSGEVEEEILRRFSEDRAEEYAELKEQCADFLAEIDREIGRQNYSFAEYEENEQDLNKLETWFEKVKQRDFVGSEQARQAEQWMEKCRQQLQHYASMVVDHEDHDHNHKMSYDPGKPVNT